MNNLIQIFNISDFYENSYYCVIDNRTQYIIPLGICVAVNKHSILVDFCWHDGPTYKITYKLEFDSHIKTELHSLLENFVCVSSNLNNQFKYCKEFQHYSFYTLQHDKKLK